MTADGTMLYCIANSCKFMFKACSVKKVVKSVNVRRRKRTNVISSEFQHFSDHPPPRRLHSPPK